LHNKTRAKAVPLGGSERGAVNPFAVAVHRVPPFAACPEQRRRVTSVVRPFFVPEAAPEKYITY